MEKLEWNKNILGTNLEILRGSERIGSISWPNLFSNKARAEFRGKTLFITRDLLTSRIEIFDGIDQSLLGRISLGFFSPKSDVVVNGKRFELEVKNFRQSKWAWKFNSSELISFSTSDFITREKGEIELFSACNEEVEILILLGLVLRNQLVIIILFFLILASLFIL